MDLKQLRDTLILRKGEYNEAVKTANRNVSELKDIMDTITTEDYLLLQKLGIDISFLTEMSPEQLTTDKDYLENIKLQFENSINLLCKNLEESLCIKSV